MAKAKVVTALALTVVMLVVMTGLAAAGPEGIYPDPIHANSVPIDGSIFTYNVTIVTTAAGNHYFNMSTDTEEIEARITGPVGCNDASGYTANSTNWTATSDISMIWNATNPNGTDGTSYYFDLEVRAKNPPASEGLSFKVHLHDNEGNSYNPGAYEEAEGTCHGTTVPEFTTIAIPVAAILGLVLFYSHRKRKEE